MELAGRRTTKDMLVYCAIDLLPRPGNAERVLARRRITQSAGAVLGRVLQINEGASRTVCGECCLTPRSS